MNKKIISIFALVMAVSIFGISCSNKSTEPETITITPSAGVDSANPLDFGIATAGTVAKENLTFTTKPAGIKVSYKIKSVVKDKDDTNPNNTDLVLKKEHFTYDGSQLTIDGAGATEIVRLTPGQYNQAIVIMTASADGYNKDVKVYVKFAKKS